MTKHYIGDGVYLEDNGWNWILTTENGISVQNSISLEKPMIDLIHQIVSKKESNG